MTTYEMQWTVRYFIYRQEKWAEAQVVEAEPRFVSAGALAYAKRKQSTWQQLAVKSDRTFRIINNAYKSPL